MKPSYRRHNLPGQKGMTLIELLVGMVISLAAIVAIYQILSVWDGRRRTLTAGSNAQVSGTIGSFEVERDLKLAGMGFGNVIRNTIGCTVQATNSGLPTANFAFQFLPILITDGAGGAPDSLRVLYGNSAYSNSVQQLRSSTASAKVLESKAGYNAGDLAVVAGNTPRDCALLEVTGPSVVPNEINHDTTAYTKFYPPSGTMTPSMNPAPGAATFTTGEMYNLGPGPQLTEWTVNPATTVLSRRNVLRQTATFEVTEGIVNLQAQYGVDANGDGLITATEWTITLPTNLYTILAVRYALLSRSNQYEKDTEVTSTAPTWSAGAFTMRNLDGSLGVTTGVNDWRRYRHKVFETSVTLRNMLWGVAL